MEEETKCIFHGGMLEMNMYSNIIFPDYLNLQLIRTKIIVSLLFHVVLLKTTWPKLDLHYVYFCNPAPKPTV